MHEGETKTGPLAGPRQRIRLGRLRRRPRLPEPGCRRSLADYKEIKGWKIAVPRDDVDKGDWWSIYHDPVLTGLEQLVEIDNQTLKAAEAAYREAHAIVAEARAQLFPTLTADPSLNRTNATHWMATIEGVATWEPDLWGRVRRTIESDASAAQASAADIANARLSAQASLATTISSCAKPILQDLLNQTVGQYKRSLRITQNQYSAGTGRAIGRDHRAYSAADDASARHQRRRRPGPIRARHRGVDRQAACRPDAETWQFEPIIPTVPVGLPSALLERRPDVACSRAADAAENALIGVAIAAYYPT